MPLLGPLLSPLAVAISRSSPCAASALGYQSVGMKPSASCGNGKTDTRLYDSVAVSNTATAFSEASATNSLLPSGDCARALG